MEPLLASFRWQILAEMSGATQVMIYLADRERRTLIVSSAVADATEAETLAQQWAAVLGIPLEDIELTFS